MPPGTGRLRGRLRRSDGRRLPGARPEEWNLTEHLDGTPFPNRVFAPSVGGRPVSLHVRTHGPPPARYALLSRGYLRTESEARHEWGAFKLRVASEVIDLEGYGRIKAAAQPLLMATAERWVAETGWQPFD